MGIFVFDRVENSGGIGGKSQFCFMSRIGVSFSGLEVSNVLQHCFQKLSSPTTAARHRHRHEMLFSSYLIVAFPLVEILVEM